MTDQTLQAEPEAAAVVVQSQPEISPPRPKQIVPTGMVVQRLDTNGAPIGKAKRVINQGRIPVNRKFSPSAAKAIRERRAAGEKINDLAAEFACCRHTVQRLIKGVCYPELQA